jgi:hypothetical protein
MRELPREPSAAVKRLNPSVFEPVVAQKCPQDASEAPKPSKRIRQSTKPLLNKLEEEFLEHLQTIWLTSRIQSQSIRFKLGNGIWYKPDFVVPMVGHTCEALVAYEVKGPHAFRGGFENLKVAASLYPWIKWILVWKEDGEWREQEVLP